VFMSREINGPNKFLIKIMIALSTIYDYISRVFFVAMGSHWRRHRSRCHSDNPYPGCGFAEATKLVQQELTTKN